LAVAAIAYIKKQEVKNKREHNLVCRNNAQLMANQRTDYAVKLKAQKKRASTNVTWERVLRELMSVSHKRDLKREKEDKRRLKEKLELLEEKLVHQSFLVDELDLTVGSKDAALAEKDNEISRLELAAVCYTCSLW